MNLSVVTSRKLLFPTAKALVQKQSSRCISAAALTVELKDNDADFQNRPAPKDLVFGTTFTDHMLMVEYCDGKWQTPHIKPYQNLSLSPAASCLHYGLECFEGMKAYKCSSTDNSIRLFRPDMNMKRLRNSMNRLHMPGYDFDSDQLIECIAELVRTDQKWIPGDDGYSLYIRPTVIATHRLLGLSAPKELLLFVICSPVGPYYKTGTFQPVKLTTDTPYVRAWPGGTGQSKVGGNYAATMKAGWEAAEAGYNQVLWLFGDDDQVTEVGAMNVFFVFQNENGVPELVTPPLDRGDILPGVTRDSILQLARSWPDDEITVSERFPTMPEIVQAAEESRLLEAFGAGTAAVVTPIRSIQYQSKDIEIPATGEVTKRVYREITGIQYGKIEGPAGWSVKI